MTCAWVKAGAVAAALLVAACGRGEAGADAGMAAENLKAAEVFMEKNASAEGIQTLPSGLQYKVLRAAPDGAESPDGNDLVRVHYEGALTDGTVFDSSYERGMPYVTTPEQVVPGWTEALQRMKVGDEWMLYVPPELGYGARQAGPDIPANSVLVFRMELLAVAKAPGAGSSNTARV